MEEKTKSSSWWQTLPGILTAVAALITAVGGAAVAFHQAGFFDHAGQRAPQVQNDPARPSKGPENSGAIDTNSGGTNSSTNPSTGSRPLTLPPGSEVKAGEATYKILSARLDPFAPGKLSLKFEVRMVNNGRYNANFWAASFRLLADGLPMAPVNFLDELVESHTAKDAAVEFVIPDTVNNVGLQVGEVGEGKPAILISLKP
jgi:hypothetical protein